jgi:hypothetical protein
MSDDEEWLPSASVLNVRADLALTGGFVGGPGEVAEAICDLLRSPFEIEERVRHALADALERGRSVYKAEETNDIGQAIPRLVVEGLGRTGDVSKAVLVRRQWLDAAEEVQDAVDAGARVDETVFKVGRKFKMGVDVMRKARRLYNKFLTEYHNNDSSLHAEVRDQVPSFTKQDYDYFYIARSLFIDREAEAAVKRKHTV